MASQQERILRYLRRLLQGTSEDALATKLADRTKGEARHVPGGSRISRDAIEKRWSLLTTSPSAKQALAGAPIEELEIYQSNIENCIGTVKLPVGLAGPLRIHGLFAKGDYYVPLATTEAALVASYSRGAQVMTEAGGCVSILLQEAITRTPGFAFQDLIEAGRFAIWCITSRDTLQKIAAGTTKHGELSDVGIAVEGNHVYLLLEFVTGDASGQNMVTIATKAICDYIRTESPIRPEYGFVEANLSGDKKATSYAFTSVRGKKVSAEVRLPAQLVRERLHTTPREMERYWRMSAIGGVQSGSMGIQGHYANAMAAFYIACGQDPACVAESAVGITRFEVTDKDELYASVTLPSIIVGTVGGGTGLPTQNACLEILGLAGSGKAQALAEVCAALALAGELSITAALCADEFSQAHERLARGRAKKEAASTVQPHD